MLLRRTIGYFLTAIFFCQVFGNNFITLEFYANRDFIVKNYCENRDRPSMHCNGKCQLRKKLASDDNHDKQSSERRIETRNEVLSPITAFPSMNVVCLVCNQQKYFITNSALPSTLPLAIFHPPQGFFI